MGCSQSIANDHPSMFKAKNLNGKDKSVNSVVIEVENTKIVVRSRNRKVMASWPISCLRRYGCTQDVLFIEAGNGCDTGQGMYLFKCHRTDQVFELLKKKWRDIQVEHENTLSSGSHLMPFTALPSQPVITTHNHVRQQQQQQQQQQQSQAYYNYNHANNSRHLSSNGSNNSGGVLVGNGNVPFSSLHSPSFDPAMPRGSTSSQQQIGCLEALPEDSALRLDTSDEPFPLQPAPASRQEMMTRRRINSEMVASYNRNSERVTLQKQHRHNSESANYQNNDIIDAHSNSYPRRHQVSYNSSTQAAQISAELPSTALNGSVTKRGSSASTALSPDAVDSVSHDISMMSLRSDCEPLLTPGSNGTSGIGSLNGNGSASSNNQNPPPPVPPHPPTTSLLVSDPWKRQPSFNKFIPHHRLSPAYRSHSLSCEYVNTANASMDVSGTPLPATAKATHFTFDFDMGAKTRMLDRHKLNYVPVEAFKSGDDFNCGASSASSGIPGTPRTPKTPTSHPATDYAIIDHKKTLALSNIHKARQRERKSRHESSGENGLMNGV